MQTNNIPNPGSVAAGDLGCNCPVLDNAHGRGYMGVPNIFVWREDCPIHGYESGWKHPEPTEEESPQQQHGETRTSL